MLLERGEALLEIHAYLLVESWRGGYLRHVDHLQKESTEWPLTSKKNYLIGERTISLLKILVIFGFVFVIAVIIATPMEKLEHREFTW